MQKKVQMKKKIHLPERWTLSSKEKNIRIPLRIPGDNCTALLRAKLLPDPYYSDNEKLWRWVGETDWQMSTQFSLRKEDLRAAVLHLCLSFVDCYATVYVNEKKIGKTSNAFSSYRFNCKSCVREGTNTLRLDFASPVKEALSRAKKLKFPMPNGYNYRNVPETKHMNLLRKPQCHGGWDWGITLMVSGIYNPVYIEPLTQGHMVSLTHKQRHKREGKKVTVHVDACLSYDALRAGKMRFTARLGGAGSAGAGAVGGAGSAGGVGNLGGAGAVDGAGSAGGNLGGEQKEKVVDLRKGTNEIRLSFVLVDPSLWWPAGYGEQPLYELSVQDDEGHSITQKIGLRELVLLNKKDALGSSFEIRVNDMRIFCKGANWIPCDALPERQSEEKYRNLLCAAKKANMNMLRVWGGGQYERDCFYRICDEEGILVWHDLMFACSLYPSEAWFLKEVCEELEYQIPRLQHHPCIALWCGDNEMVGALSWYDEAKQFPQRYLANYTIFNRALATSCKSLDDSRTFWPSSPSNGGIDFDGSWQDDKSGDMHFWEVWHSGASFEEYKSVRPRFCSEFGFQSFPSIQTIRSFADRSQFNVSSPAMEHHQKNEMGNSIIVEMFLRYFRMPNNFANQVYLSQVQQSLAISLAVEYWRSTMPTCLGTLFWQLNDNWPVSSWSSIEYNGRWKLLHYVMARSYSPVLVTTRFDSERDRLSLFAVNDTAKKMHCTVHLRLWQLRKQPYRCVYTKKLQAELAPSSSRNILECMLKELTKESYRDCFCSVDYQVREQGDKGSRSVSVDAVVGNKKSHSVVADGGGSKVQFFEKYKCYDLPIDTIHAVVQNITPYECSIELSSRVPVFFLMLDCKMEGQFSDNCINLLPSVSRKLRFSSGGAKPIDAKKLEKALSFVHLASSYR